MISLEGEEFGKLLERAIGVENVSRASVAFKEAPAVSVRLNPSKTDGGFAGRVFGSGLVSVPWSRHGYILPTRPSFTLDPCFHAGCYYVQESSAMYVGEVSRSVLPRFEGLGRPVRVLDLCAAPGGKTTDLATSLRQVFGDSFILVANEVMKGRAGILADNVALWGDPNVLVTSADPKAFSVMEGFFDIIVADVPCSGEGMFRKDPKALEDWSVDLVNLCASRQKRIVSDVWPALRQGGALVYSTCTFEEAENDANVEWIAENLGAGIISREMPEGIIKTRTGGLLVPGFVPGEGQFAAALVKTSASPEVRRRSRPKSKKVEALPRSPLFEGIEEMVTMKGGLLVYVPKVIAEEAEALEALRPIRSGVAVGTVKGHDVVPDSDFALMAGRGEPFPTVDLEKNEALRYLRRESVFVEGKPKGYLTVRYDGHPLGFVKNLGTRWNNLHPQGRRIRMEID